MWRKGRQSVVVEGSDTCDRPQPFDEVFQDDFLTKNDGSPDDFSTKPIDVGHLHHPIKRALDLRSLPDEVVSVREQLPQRYSFPNIVSKNARMHAIFDLIGKVAQTATTVLIEGETGTGKEQVARAVHQASRVRSGPMIAVNCAALPEHLLESELFGHEKGSFTGAVGQRRGRFELADRGTLFLDEVGDIPATMQVKLLRVLQERRFERVGGTQPVAVDVRVIGASNRSLRRLVLEGKFREDLYYRLNVVKIDLPPLRERRDDIPLLATYFTVKYARPQQARKQITSEALAVLMRYAWPGNIRELENVIERACVTSLDESIQPKDLPLEVVELPKDPASDLGDRIDLTRPLSDLLSEMAADIERRYIRKALQKTHGNIGRCARLCGLSLRSIITKVAKYKIDKSEFERP